MFINPNQFPDVKFVKKDEKYKIEAKIKEIEESLVVLDDVISFNKTSESAGSTISQVKRCKAKTN